jgi:hypothetical protein
MKASKNKEKPSSTLSADFSMKDLLWVKELASYKENGPIILKSIRETQIFKSLSTTNSQLKDSYQPCFLL